MKFPMVVAVAFGVCVGLAGAQDAKKEAPKAAESDMKDLRAKASYAIGLNIGRNFKSQSVDIDPEAVLRGLKDGFSGAKAQLTDEQMRQVLTEFQQEMAAKQEAVAKAQGEKSLKEGAAFLAANAKKPGVKTTKSGLQYKVIKDGTGKSPKLTDNVTTNYRGTLIDGREFDSSYKRGEPATFPVDGVIKGWTEALQLMKEGSKWELYVPTELAYGENPRPGGIITPNAALIFEIELIKVEPGQ